MACKRLAPLFLLALAACGAPESTAPNPMDPSPDTMLSQAEQTELVMLLDDYANKYGCVDDALRWAPTLCRAPPVSIRMSKASLRMSDASGNDAHARKLYWLFAKSRVAYLAVKQKREQPVGQLLIKEAWVPKAGDAPESAPGPYGDDSSRPVHNLKRSVEHEGARWHAGTKHALFVLWKREADTPDTDAGWTYATLTPDGRTVTASGRLASCMKCHRDATHDRLFGLP